MRVANKEKFALSVITCVTSYFLNSAIADVQSSYFDCGTRGDNVCTVDDWEYSIGGIGLCDRGLRCDGEVYECTGLTSTVKCSNDYPPRQRESQFAENIKNSWANGAMAQQRLIARHEPVNWIGMLGSHNAFNNRADGYAFSQHDYSMTDQLEMGARALMLDVHRECWVLTGLLECNVRLSHGLASFGDRHVGFGIIEIGQWLDKAENNGEVILLHLEHFLENNSEAEEDLAWVLNTFLGEKMLRRSEVREVPAHEKWPKHLDHDLFYWPSLAELQSMGKQVIVLGAPDDLYEKYDFFFSSNDDKKKHHWFPEPEDFDWQTCKLGRERRVSDGYPFKFYGIEEARLANGPDNQQFIAEDCLIDFAYDDKCAQIGSITKCGNSGVFLDWLGEPIEAGFPFAKPTGDRFSGLVWSWQPDVEGWKANNQAAVVSASDPNLPFGTHGRFVNRPFDEQHHYACGLFREGDWTLWDTEQREAYQPLSVNQLTEWRITEAVGPYELGGYYCSKEHPGFVFSVPVNGAQLKQLLVARDDLMPHLGKDPAEVELWIAYRDLDLGAPVKWDRDVPCILGLEASPNSIWPPNRKMVDVELSVSHRCPIEPQCVVTDVESEDPGFEPGDFKLDLEYPLLLRLRAERSGFAKEGRVYEISLECIANENGRIDRVSAEVVVHHDQRR